MSTADRRVRCAHLALRLVLHTAFSRAQGKSRADTAQDNSNRVAQVLVDRPFDADAEPSTLDTVAAMAVAYATALQQAAMHWQRGDRRGGGEQWMLPSAVLGGRLLSDAQVCQLLWASRYVQSQMRLAVSMSAELH
jgi:hypothetical protein